MKGYFRRLETTAQAIRDGWFHTEDLGYRDRNGYYYVTVRLKDPIIRDGYNVYPREIEEVLCAHPDPIEAAVIGRRDDRLGEEVIAYVVLRFASSAEIDELDTHCRDHLAGHRYPREFRVVDELPKGATGKILKGELET